jgi:hypothetical protein
MSTLTHSSLETCRHCGATNAILGDCFCCVGCCALHCDHQHDCHMECLACGDQAARGGDYCGGTVCRGTA